MKNATGDVSAGAGSSLRAIFYALGANSGIAVAKGVAAIYTGSGSMLAETIHSVADCGNQILLLIGMKRAKRPPTAEHPLGHGKVVYFWSFIVAVLLFSVGGLFSVYEGVHKLHGGSVLKDIWVALLVLGFSIVLESFSLYGAMKEINKMRRGIGLWAWLKTSRNAELIVVFGEDVAALLGLGLAFGFLLAAAVTGNAVYDAVGSIAIGVILIIIAVFVAIRVKALLIGRSADPDIREKLVRMIAAEPSMYGVFNIITMQFGPDIMLAAKVRMDPGMTVERAAEKINDVERRIKAEVPEIRWSFIEPDVR